MKTSFLALRMFAAPTIALTIAGCGGAASPIASSPAMPGALVSQRHHEAPHLQPNSANLLYVTSYGLQKVYVYHYPSLNPAGVLTEVAPFGLCINDANGDIYVVDRADGYNLVDGYHHGATTPFTTLTLGSVDPISCAVDPTTGNLAVTTDNSVAIFLNAAGSPNFVSSTIGNMWGAGYDPNGNLFVDDSSFGGYAEISHTNPLGPMVPVTLQATIAHPGGVQWDGHHMTVGDQYAQIIYQLKPNGHTFGTVSLPGSVEVPYYDVLGHKVVATDRNLHKIYLYNYDTGTMINSITLPADDVLGIGISQ